MHALRFVLLLCGFRSCVRVSFDLFACLSCLVYLLFLLLPGRDAVRTHALLLLLLLWLGLGSCIHPSDQDVWWAFLEGCGDVRLARGVSSSLRYAAYDYRCGGGGVVRVCCSRFASVKSFVSSANLASTMMSHCVDTSDCFLCSDGSTVLPRASGGWQGGGSCDKACRNF